MRATGHTGANPAWERRGDYGMVCGPWKIGKYITGSRTQYALWRDGVDRAIGYFDSFDEAKRHAL